MSAGPGHFDGHRGVERDEGAARLSRRRLISGAAAGAGLMTAVGIGRAAAVGSTVDRSASANDPARRLEIPEFTPAPPTTVPAVPFRPPEVGEILFPLGVGDDWNAYVLDNYGDTRGRCCGYFHQGVDIMADEGTPQLAVVDGELTKRHQDGFWGWTLLGDDDITYRYFHSAEDANGWVEGDRVQQGDVIGFVSDSGTSAGNFHLHFEYRPGNEPADSYGMLQRMPGAIFQN